MTSWDFIVGCIGATLGWYFACAQEGRGPFIAVGSWRNEQAARKTLRLLYATAPWPQRES